jgi:proteasome lid subunit RPN8/RPN11
MPITPTIEELRSIYAHALESYPEECCGLIANHNGERRVFRCSNAQNRLHAIDPKAYPRDARTAYTLDPEQLLRILRFLGSEESIRLVYHSHPDHDAYFSPEDRRQALVFGSEPGLPHAAQLVVSVRGTGSVGALPARPAAAPNGRGRRVVRIHESRLYLWDEAQHDFRELPLTAAA